MVRGRRGARVARCTSSDGEGEMEEDVGPIMAGEVFAEAQESLCDGSQSGVRVWILASPLVFPQLLVSLPHSSPLSQSLQLFLSHSHSLCHSVQHDDSFRTLVAEGTRLSLATRGGGESDESDVQEEETESEDHQVKADAQMRAVLGGPTVADLFFRQDVFAQLEPELSDPGDTRSGAEECCASRRDIKRA